MPLWADYRFLTLRLNKLSMSTTVIKASGRREEFDERKVLRAVKRAGASDEVARRVTDELDKRLYDGITTREIYRITFDILNRERHSLASRYDLKRAIMRLGPAGFSFETYLGEILREHGHSVEIRQMIPGKCVVHEIDVVCEEKPGSFAMIECKYHNSEGIYTGLKQTLYTYARFLDLRKGWDKRGGMRFDSVWLATNTKFSDKAREYGGCKGMRLLGWRYPRGEGIETMIEGKGLYPVTILRRLDDRSKEKLSDANLMIIKDLLEGDVEDLAYRTRISEKKIRGIVAEAKEIHVG